MFHFTSPPMLHFTSPPMPHFTSPSTCFISPLHPCFISPLHLHASFHLSIYILHFTSPSIYFISPLHLYTSFHLFTYMLHFISPPTCFISPLHLYTSFHLSIYILHFTSSPTCFISPLSIPPPQVALKTVATLDWMKTHHFQPWGKNCQPLAFSTNSPLLHASNSMMLSPVLAFWFLKHPLPTPPPLPPPPFHTSQTLRLPGKQPQRQQHPSHKG